MGQTRPYGGFLVMGTRPHPTQNLTIWTFSGHVPYPPLEVGRCRWAIERAAGGDRIVPAGGVGIARRWCRAGVAAVNQLVLALQGVR